MIQCKVIEQRRSIRFYDTNKKIDQSNILECIEAATKAPSPYNRQPWCFKIITSHETIEHIAEQLINNHWVRIAPVIVVIGIEKSEGKDILKNYLAVGAAIENMILEAQQRGIATCWIGDCLGNNMETLLNWPPDCEIVSMVTMGYKRDCEMSVAVKKRVDEVMV